MPFFKKESLETLRQRIDLVDLVSSYLQLKKMGNTYKALCPFHEEKTPSFVIGPGDHHYHCYGCGAHGDAIEFLMMHLQLSFSEAVELLAHRFQVKLEYEESRKGDPLTDTKKIRQALSQASRFYHYYLLHSQEGRKALSYLYNRGIQLDFIKQFRLGLAPHTHGMMQKVLNKMGFDNELLKQGALLRQQGSGYRDFFCDRILFPILDPTGLVIGFSSRKYKESTFGPKYVNSPETPVFKKSKVLFGLHASRREIAKQHKALIVEGQIDALRLIYAGYPLAVATQGTAFGEGHLHELIRLGVKSVYIAFDSDHAGKEAAYKVGDMFQQKGVGVKVVKLPENHDPDNFVLKQGLKDFVALVDKSQEYLDYAIDYWSQQMDVQSPAGKTMLVKKLKQQIQSWEDKVMVYESLKTLGLRLQLPLQLLELPSAYGYQRASLNRKTSKNQGSAILEKDLLRLMFFFGKTQPEKVQKVLVNLDEHAFLDPLCREFFQLIAQEIRNHQSLNAFNLTYHLEENKHSLFKELMEKKVYPKRAEQMLHETIKSILDRNWLRKREKIAKQLKDNDQSEEENNQLLKEFGKLSISKPVVKEVLTS